MTQSDAHQGQIVTVPSVDPAANAAPSSTLSPSEQDESQPFAEPDALLPHSRPDGKSTHSNREKGGSKNERRNCGESRFSQWLGAWSLELLSCVLSIVALGMIILLLRQYDKQPPPTWPLGITLNTVLALLATITKAAFAYPVFQGISQMKWDWYAQQTRPLSDLQAFDSASRGVFGVKQFLVVTKGR
jgi:hypothetical protein